MPDEPLNLPPPLAPPLPASAGPLVLVPGAGSSQKVCEDFAIVAGMQSIERSTEMLTRALPSIPTEGKGLFADCIRACVKTQIGLAKLIEERNPAPESAAETKPEETKPAATPPAESTAKGGKGGK